MTPNPLGLALVLAAYVCGSVPSAYLAGRWMTGIDLRTIGSGNLGATNVYRELGLVPALVVLAVDALKGAIPTLFFPALVTATAQSATAREWWALAFGSAAIIGHTKPVFLLWKGGGKGVATAAGVFLAVTPVAMGLCIAVFVLVVAITRFVSLGSVVAALSLPLWQWMTTGATPSLAASTAIAVFVTWAHRPNMRRIHSGTEPRLGRRRSASS